MVLSFESEGKVMDSSFQSHSGMDERRQIFADYLLTFVIYNDKSEFMLSDKEEEWHM